MGIASTRACGSGRAKVARRGYAAPRRVFEELVQGGLTGVECVVSDEHHGLVEAIRRFFPEAVHQRCQVQYLRNPLDHVSSETTKEQVVAGLRDVWRAPTRAEAEARLTALITRLRPTLARVAEWLDGTASDTLAVFTLADRTARRRLETTNSIEHDHMAVRPPDIGDPCIPERSQFHPARECAGDGTE